ncbi:hypothetical protein [Flavobacterium facile]|uniref:hypothetical protein n=1 Tax=Flavobacterium facile TaxID=2893174 RepID=UPI002E798F2F|nr:hypothetical protein [Flavobacterium sp. T-12]
MRELNNEERLLDFIAFILADYSELLDNVNYFFCENYSKEVLLKYDKNKESNIYKFYLKETIDFEYLNTITNVNYQFNFTELDKVNLIKYINDNYRHGYPDDFEDGLITGGNLKINIDKEQFDLYLEEYTSLCEINKTVYISYFKYNLIESEDAILNYLRKEHIKIKTVFKNSFQINSELKLEFVNYHKDKYKLRYLESFNDNKFFYIVNKNENDEFVLNFKISLLKQLVNINEINIDMDYSKDDIDYENSLNEIYYNLFLNCFEGKPLSRNEEGNNKIYNSLLDDKKDYIEYLNKKGFTSNDINNILNILSSNSLSELGFKFIKRYNLKKVETFVILYCFYVFDFFNEVRDNRLEKIIDFDEVVKFQSLNVKLDKEQFRKYYKDINNNKGKHYPFSNYEETIKLFTNDDIIYNKSIIKQKPKNQNINFF